MRFISSIMRRTKAAEPIEQRGWLTDPHNAGGLFMLDAWGSADAGVTVTPENALQAASVWACVSRIARDLSTLPLHVIDRQTDRRDTTHPVARLLRNPNQYQAGPGFMQTFMMNLLLYGQAAVYLERTRGRYPSSLYPLMSRSVQPGRINGELIYRVSTTQTLRAEEVASVVHMSADGINGTSPIRMGGRTIGTDIALAQFAARYFKNGAAVGTVFELPPMGPDALKETHRILKQQYEGGDNAHRLVAIPQVKVHRTSNSPRDSQAVEARQFQLGEVARLFNMPIGLLDAERSKYAGLEAQYRDYAQATLRPWAVLIEAELSRKLFLESEQDRYAIRFNLDAIVRADLSARADADAKLVQAGVMTPNEARAHHELAPMDGGDTLLSPLNMTPAAERSVTTRSQPTPPADDDTDPQLLLDCLDVISAAQQAQQQVETLTRTIAEGIAAKEAKALQAAAKRHDDLNTWAAEWFEGHREHLRSRLPTLTDDSIDQLTEEARDAIIEAQGSGTTENVVADWKNARKLTIFQTAMA
jgi:HK97 family phage portal protein